MSETLESPSPKTETHKSMGGKVNICRRENSDNWQGSTFLNGPTGAFQRMKIASVARRTSPKTGT